MRNLGEDVILWSRGGGVSMNVASRGARREGK